MEQDKQSLDLRTLLVLVAEYDEVPWDKIMNLIAEEVDVPAEKLKAALIDKASATKSTSGSSRFAEKESSPEKAQSKRSYSRWGDDRLNELVNRWNKGEKPGQIAKEMGVSTQTVYQKISKLRKDRDDIKPRTSRNPAFQAHSRN